MGERPAEAAPYQAVFDCQRRGGRGAITTYISLRQLINKGPQNQEGSSQLTAWLSSFSCERDKDIEDFLHNRAIPFEIANKSRTYLAVEETLWQAEKRVSVLGFFTVSLKVLNIPEGFSNRRRLELDGFAAKIHGKVIKSVPCYLIGQLAKNSAIQNAVGGSALLNEALSTINLAVEKVGGRYVLIECRDDPHLRKFYTDNGFVEFDTLPDENLPMVQMVRPLHSKT